MSILFIILFFIFFGKIIGFAIKAAWGITKVVLTIVFLPLIFFGLFSAGLITVGIILLVIGLIVSFIGSAVV